MTPDEIIENLKESYPDCLFADGFEGAIIGLVEGACREPVVCYDYDACVLILVGRGMDEGEADEYMQFNVTGAFVGKMTPLFVHDWRKEEDD